MQKLVIPVLILATVALSSSILLPEDSLQLPQIEYKYQPNDNTFSNKEPTRKLNAILFNFDVGRETDKIPNYVDNNDDFNIKGRDTNYNVKGFRKEQWHNYPRQLDRLNRYFYQHQSNDKRNLDPDDPTEFDSKPERTYEEISDKYKTDSERNYEEINDKYNKDYAQRSYEEINEKFKKYDSERNYDETNDKYKELTNEYVPEYEETTNNEAEMAAAVINPLLILRIHLDCYKPNQVIDRDIEASKEGFWKELNPGSNQIKVKREDKTKDDVESEHASDNPTVNKRIFALFSRLQSLSPKGHQLHHRRHLYAMYGQPDNEGGGVLTAETRATFMRPPGSPLRWG